MTYLKKITVVMVLVATIVFGGINVAAIDDGIFDLSPDQDGKTFSDEFQRRYGDIYADDDSVRAIVIMDASPTADNDTFIQRLTNSENRIRHSHELLLRKMEKKKVEYDLNYEYTSLLNGISVTVAYGELETIADLPGVEKVYIANHFDEPTVETRSISAAEMTNALWSQETISGDGSGTTVAILDTGITLQHESFQVYDGMLATPAYDKTTMLNAITDLGRGAYYSQKVPFQHDYADNDNNANDDTSGHGTHVCGIAAGYAVDGEGAISFRGAAPDAQILAMKVFGSGSTGTSSDIYYAALEDAYKLGVDVINMSLGAANGFTYDESLETEVYGNIFARLRESGILCCISAGNDGSMADFSQVKAGKGYLTPDYPDYAVLSTPASYDGNVAVAAVDNARFPGYSIIVNGEAYPYRESNGTAFINKFGGSDVPYVIVSGQGEAADYQDLEVKGKIAVVDRGVTTFENKVATAAAAGAAGVVVCNHQDDGLISMSVTTTSIPSIFVAKDAGDALKNMADKGRGFFTVGNTKSEVINPTGWTSSYFSSWGCTNDLQLKPQIAGVGGSVESAENGTVDGYVIKSGTSMSAPTLTGGYAALTEILRREDPSATKKEIAERAEKRSEETARILTRADDTAFSPRQQGSGLLDLKAAAMATAEITTPLIELGDDPQKNGRFSISMEVRNISDTQHTYAISAEVLTDSVEEVPVNYRDNSENRLYNALKSRSITDKCAITGDQSVTLMPGEKKTITVTIELSDDLKKELDETFIYGTFIEGYLRLSENEETLHGTYLGFYGDWNAAPIIESHDWRDVMDLPSFNNYLDNVTWDINTDISLGYICDSGGEAISYAGANPMGKDTSIAYAPERIAVSSNSASAKGIALKLVPTVIRNARHVIMIVRDADTGEIYATRDEPYCEKTIYDSQYEMWTSSCTFYFDATASYQREENVYDSIPNNTKVQVELYANIPYGEDHLGNMTAEEIVASGDQYLQYVVPCTVDNEEPTILSWHYDQVTGDVTVTAADNQYLAGIAITDLKKTTLASKLFGDIEPGKSHTVTLNIGKQRNFIITCEDYASNEKQQRVSAVIDPKTVTYHTPKGITTRGPASLTVSAGDQIVLPHVDGEIEGWEFAQWSQSPATSSHDPLSSAETNAGNKYKVNSDTDWYAVFRTIDGTYSPGERLRRLMAEPANFNGIYALAGVNWLTYEPSLLTASGRTEKASSKGVAFEESSVFKQIPDDCLFELRHEADATYTIRSVANEKYLAFAPDATYALSMIDNDKDLAAHWRISYFAGDRVTGDVGCFRIVNVKDSSHRLVFDTTIERMKCAKINDRDFSDEFLMYLFGTMERYRYTTSPQPIHLWDDGVVTKEATVENEGEIVYTCHHCGTTKTEKLPKSKPIRLCDGGDSCPGKAFRDVDRSSKSWYHLPLDWAVEKNVTKGITATLFEPTGVCTRAQVVTFLWRVAGSPEPKKSDTGFVDVSAKAYYSKAVAWAVTEGITAGTDATHFSPNTACARAQVVTFLWRAMGKKEAIATANYDDVDYDAYYGKAVTWAVANDITGGVSATKFAPAASCTRAQIVTFLYRVYN